MLALPLSSSSLHAAPDEDLNDVSPPVGIVHLELQAQAPTLVSLPVEPFNDAIEAVFGAQCTEGDRILKWRPELQGYQTAYRTGGDAARWTEDPDGTVPSTMTLGMGEGFWIVNAQATARTVIVTGEIAVEPVRDVTVAADLNLLAFPYSTGIAVTNTVAPAVLSEMLTPDADGHYRTSERFVLGRGYWCWPLDGAAGVWTQPRPYAAPFPTNGLPPRVDALTLIEGGAAVRLTIVPAGRRLDILYQDLTPAGVVDPSVGWRPARIALPVPSGSGLLYWEDRGAGDRPPVSAVFGRCYLVTRADVDADANGIPDPRERFVAGLKLPGPSAAAVAADDGDAATPGAGGAPGAANGAARVIHVDAAAGDDRFDGHARIPDRAHGPKRSLRAAWSAARDGDTIHVWPGVYTGNNGARFGGKAVDTYFHGDAIVN